jgi:hypothetical protein
VWAETFAPPPLTEGYTPPPLTEGIYTTAAADRGIYAATAAILTEYSNPIIF